MGTLEQVMQLQQEGKSDTEIATQLQQSGISAVEVQNAISQAKIKNAVSPPEAPMAQESASQPEGIPNMTPSMMSTPEAPQPTQPPIQAPAPQQTPEEYMPQAAPEEYYTPQPQGYLEQAYYPDTGGYGPETISEIAEQVATEKLEDYKSKVGDIASFKTGIQNKVDDIDDRLKRIENSIDKLQQAILGKIGEFGESSAMIHQDLNNLHGTVSKLMNPLIDNINELKKVNKK